MTMQQNISRIAAAKEDIRQAIIDKGVNVEATDLIGDYAAKIAQIQSTSPNIITFERFTERINKTKKSITSINNWQSIVSTNTFIADELLIDDRLHNTALLLTTELKIDKNFQATANNIRTIIDLEWLDANNNVIKQDLNLEPVFKMARTIDGINFIKIGETATTTGYYVVAMFGLRIYDIPGYNGVPAGATKLKLSAIKTEIQVTEAVYIDSGAGTLCAVISNEGHEDPPTPPPTETANYKVYIVSGGQEIEVSDAETAQDSQNALVLFYNNTKKVRYFSGSMEPTKMTPQGPVMGPQTEIELTTSPNFANSGVVFANTGINVKIGNNYSILTLSNYVSNVIIDTVNKKILIQN